MALPAPGGGIEAAGAVVPQGEDGAPLWEWGSAHRRWEEEYREWERRNEVTRQQHMAYSVPGSTAAPPPAPPLPPGPVRAAAALASPFLPGACVPRGARGMAVARPASAAEAAAAADGSAAAAATIAAADDEDGDGKAALTAAMAERVALASAPRAELVTWDAPADGIRMLIARLCMLSTAGLPISGGGGSGGGGFDVGAAEAQELDATLAFLSRVLTSAPSFAAGLAACDVSGAVPAGSPPSLLAALAAVATAAISPGAAW